MPNLMLSWQQAALLAAGFGAAGLLLRHGRWGARVGPFAREAGVVIALYALWQLSGNLAAGGYHGAVAHAWWIWHTERALGLPSELSAQRFLLPHPPLSRAANLYYATMHFGMLIAMLIWLFARHRDAYPAVRNAMAASTAICLLISFIPVAPPRMLTSLGLVDLAARYGESVYGAVGPHVGADQLSAMPSVHVCWSVLVAWAVITRSTSRWRWLILVHPAATVFVVVATGNHYWADGIVAAAIVAVVLSLQALLRALLVRIRRAWPKRLENLQGTPEMRVRLVSVHAHGPAGRVPAHKHRRDRHRKPDRRAHLTAKAWRQVVLASAVPAYGFRYRRWVLDSLRYVDAQDLATGGDHIPELGDVYVDVALVSRAPRQVPGDPLSRPAEDTSERHTIDELLDRRSRVVLALIGQPGSGKSTLLAHAARRSAAMAVRGRLGRRRVPILLALRERAEAIVTNPAISLPDVIRASVGGRPGKERGWWERQLRRGRCLVLLDGLDEVAHADDRLAVAGWIERQIAAHEGNHFVITSRSYDLLGPLTAQADVLVARPFTAKQVQLFLDRWYLAAERHATGASGRTARRAVRIRAQESAVRLTSLLREHPALHDLAVNPLLLTMIATAHRYRGALPGSRADLYGEICQVLLSRRAQAKDLPELLSWPAKQTLLAALAYQMMRDHASDLTAARVLEILGPQLERFSSLVTGEAFLDTVSRNGLLVEAPAGRYAFTHLTFQEYLAARQITASPDLVKNLTDNVSDPWWHETILLYAATADASPIVRACLDSGTIPALTLAFDCDEAGAEIDPELRQRLDRERRRAYEPDCSRAHRRLIAGVKAARLVRQTLTTATGTRICARPVPADLYWLFLADTQAPRPDSPCAPDAEQPATGMWGTEAQAFVKWLNSISATATGIEVRLPGHDELQEEDITNVLTRQLPAPVTCTWTQPGLGLWVRPGQPHPHELTGAAIRQAISVDAKNTTLLAQILTAAILNVALSVARDLDDIRALSSALAGDLTARAHSEGQRVELMHAHAHAIVLTYAHALRLTRADAIAITCAADPHLVGTLDLAGPRALADAIAGDLASAIDVAHGRAVDLAAAIDLDRSVLGAFDFDVAHARELARVHVTDLDHADALARGIAGDPDPHLARVLGLAGVHTLDPALPLPGILGLPLGWVADGPLSSTLLQVLAESSPLATSAASPLPADPYLAFALALSSRAGIHETTQLRATLGNPLTDVLRGLAEAESGRGGSPDLNRATGLDRLTNACAPICSTHQPPSPPEAAALRAVALALADGISVPGSDANGVLRTVAVTVTLIEYRSNGGATTGESIILALV